MGSITIFYIKSLKYLFPILLLPFLTGVPDMAIGEEKPENTSSVEESAPQAGKETAPLPDDSATKEDQPSNASSAEENMSQMPDSNVLTPESPAEAEKSSLEQPVYPGVVNASIIRKKDDGPSLEIYYPVFGNKPVDEAIKLFAEKQVSEFDKELADSSTPDEDREGAYEQWDLSGYYNLERPNPNVVSVIFNIYSFTGGAHGNLVINCLNFDLQNGKMLDFADLFKDPEKALEMMSAFSAKKLNTELGEYADEDMILSGTTADLNNFSNLSLTPNGLYIEFQPYQVGPWAAGPQRVEMTLQDLAAAGPEPAIWPDAATLPDLNAKAASEDEDATEASNSGKQD